jgi:predicted 3-demethylubiquinone-9 3-methyltransferase (glyoxalase superfamily)
MQKITPHLWFDSQAEEAAEYYIGLIENSKVVNKTYFPEAGQEITKKEPGSLMTVSFQLSGQDFIALNGGKVPGFEFSPAISFLISCESQEEIDALWAGLSAVPEAEQCGWCTDKFGVTWQVVPSVLQTFLADPDQAKVERVTTAFMKMKKFDIGALQMAYDG